jgi:AcrR family transcriptional regulator
MLRENRKKQTKESIIKHAIALFKQKGYENVTVEEITAACGIAKGTFFNYFPKKEQILLHITDTYMDRLHEIVYRKHEGSLKDRVMRIFCDLVVIYSKYPDLLGLTLKETMRSTIYSDMEKSNIGKFQIILAEILEKEKEKSSVKVRDSDLMASILVAVFVHTLLTQSASLKLEQTISILQEQVDIIWEGFGSE